MLLSVNEVHSRGEVDCGASPPFPPRSETILFYATEIRT